LEELRECSVRLVPDASEHGANLSLKVASHDQLAGGWFLTVLWLLHRESSDHLVCG
jgi:hypothetical protein